MGVRANYADLFIIFVNLVIAGNRAYYENQKLNQELCVQKHGAALIQLGGLGLPANLPAQPLSFIPLPNAEHDHTWNVEDYDSPRVPVNVFIPVVIQLVLALFHV